MRKNKKTIKLSKQCRLIIEKDNKFKSMGVEVIFFGKFDYKKITIYSVLSRILANSNKMYPTMQLMNQRKEELYDATLDIVYKYWYQMAVLKFVGNFVNPKYVTSKTYEEDIAPSRGFWKRRVELHKKSGCMAVRRLQCIRCLRSET